MLAAGSSAWQVNSDGTGLARRVDATATEAFTEAGRAAGAASAVGSAADQIQSAWAELYGPHPDPPAAYRAAVQAVEAAAQATIEPNNTKATLGTMLGSAAADRFLSAARLPPNVRRNRPVGCHLLMTSFYEGTVKWRSRSAGPKCRCPDRHGRDALPASAPVRRGLPPAHRGRICAGPGSRTDGPGGHSGRLYLSRVANLPEISSRPPQHPQHISSGSVLSSLSPCRTARP